MPKFGGLMRNETAASLDQKEIGTLLAEASFDAASNAGIFNELGALFSVLAGHLEADVTAHPLAQLGARLAGIAAADNEAAETRFSLESDRYGSLEV